MRIGFTGTRYGMTVQQKESLRQVLKKIADQDLAIQFRHGDCVGADDEAADIAAEVFRCLVSIVAHPPVDESHRAFNQRHNEIREPKSHFARNRDIVDHSNVLVAAPRDSEWQPKGGTWYTVDYARKVGTPVYILWPNGTIEEPQ